MSSIQARREAALQWIDERTGMTSLWSMLMDEEIPGGTRWAYIFGSGLLFVFTQQFITGILLVLYYVPSTDHAHTSVAYIQKEVLLGNFIRGLQGDDPKYLKVVATAKHFAVHSGPESQRHVFNAAPPMTPDQNVYFVAR